MAEIDTRHYQNNPSYDGSPLPPGMVRIPVLFTPEMAAGDSTVQRKNLTTWRLGGEKFLIGFAPIAEAHYAGYMKWFWRQLRDDMREKRGWDRIPEDAAEPFPDCPSEDTDRTPVVLSLNELSRRGLYEPADLYRLPVEEQVILRLTLEQLLAQLKAIDPRFVDILSMLYAGYPQRDIIRALGLKKSTGFDTIARCRSATVAFLQEPDETDEMVEKVEKVEKVKWAQRA